MTEEQKASHVVREYLTATLTEAKNRTLHRAGKEFWDQRQRYPYGGAQAVGPTKYDQPHMGGIFDELLAMTSDTERSLLVRDNLRRIGISKEVLNHAEKKLFLEGNTNINIHS